MRGIPTDGFPRTIEQAVALDAYLGEQGKKIDRVIDIDVPKEELINRLIGRRVCKACGATYHIDNMPPKKEGVCDKCDGELVQRC